MSEDKIIEKAIDKARETMLKGDGGPFGAAIIDENGNIYISSNTVLSSNDPTAHAEVNVIREACKKKGTHNLSGSVLYTTCYPCPMCLSAAIWANIKKVYYGSSAKDAAEIGFRDDYIYEFIKGNCSDLSVLDLEELKNKEECKALFKEYAEKDKEIY